MFVNVPGKLGGLTAWALDQPAGYQVGAVDGRGKGGGGGGGEGDIGSNRPDCYRERGGGGE